MHEVDVIVVGAGLAGLAAASILRRAGRAVVVLEARGRVGGRVHSLATETGGVVDVGAQWIGPGQRRMYELAARFGLATVTRHTAGRNVFEIGGRAYLSRREIPALSLRALLDVAQASLRLARAARRISASEPWRSPGCELLDQQSAAAWIDATTFTADGRELCSALLESATCADPALSSMLDLLQQTRSIDGMAHWASADQDHIAAGAQAIASGIAAELTESIELEAAVRRIEHGPAGVRVQTDRGAWRASRIIVAVPLPLVESIEFAPVLPDARRELSARVVRASVIKTVLVYDRPHWRDAGYSGFALCQSGPVSALIDGGAARGPGVLVALATARHVPTLSAMPASERQAVILDHAGRILPALAARTPEQIFACDWSAESWSGGGYAARLGPGAWTAAGRALCQPVGPIHWAGTETASEWRSYMEGALQSGERAAQEVLAAAL